VSEGCNVFCCVESDSEMFVGFVFSFCKNLKNSDSLVVLS
jgi:hypothetical protein